MTTNNQIKVHIQEEDQANSQHLQQSLAPEKIQHEEIKFSKLKIQTKYMEEFKNTNVFLA
ncbi:hypothetical protein [Cytobacillus firmus]|uniref:hypothetical protein n=1 Tax=Cytobacillus firmus TaxID=1399 RepID=UPI0018CEFAD6|nr:hypothetical protein [Cytobacillus firmus]MBG9587125.1 hypothetical protein [Cytobacillus firmus]